MGRMTYTRAVATVCMVASLALAGCGTGDAGTYVQRRQPLVEILTWWVAPGEAEAVQSLIHTHIDHYPDDRIFNTAISSELATQEMVEQRLSHGDLPDLLQVTAPLFQVIQQRHPGWLQSLDDLYDSLGLRQKIFAAAVAEVTEAGHILAMPINLHRENGLFYNKALFAAHHLQPPTTVAELMAVCKKLKAEGVTPIATARQGWILRQMLNSLIAGTMGSAVYHDYFTSKGTAGVPQIRQAIALLAEILKNYVNPDAGEDGFNWTNAAQTLFNGDAAMFFHGDWVRGYLIQLGWRPGIDFGVVGSPGASDLFIYLADSLAIPKGARNIRGARELLGTMASPAGQVAFNRVKGSTPIRSDVPAGALDPVGEATLEDFKNARVRMRAPNPPQLDSAVLKFSADWDGDALLRAFVDNRFRE
jgi:glucose/mannose transport system substrate-binding protein